MIAGEHLDKVKSNLESIKTKVSPMDAKEVAKLVGKSKQTVMNYVNGGAANENLGTNIYLHLKRKIDAREEVLND
jgi:predicted transcriptional regulator